jgi:hypothetical protein
MDLYGLNPKAVVDSEIAASFLNIKSQTLVNWRCTGRHHVPFVRIGRRIKYRVSDLLQFVEDNRVTAEVEE